MAVAVVFPGQGSQFVGMGKDFYDSSDTAKKFFNEADETLGYSLSKIMFEGSQDELRLTQNTQPALLTMSAVVWNEIKSKVDCSFFAGHSLGEYSAVYAAGGLSFKDAVRAVHNRGKFMQEAVPVGVGAMAAVLGLSDSDVITACKEFSKEGGVVEPANFNCDGQIVIAGHASVFPEFTEVLKSKGAKRVVSLPVSAPFHCSLMNKAQENMEKYFENVSFSDLNVAVVNNIDAKVEKTAVEVKDAFIRQISGSVKWTDSVKYMIDNGVDTFIEAGAGAVLTGLIKKIDKNVTCINISSIDDLSKL